MYADSMSSATIKSECKVYYIQPELFALEKTVLKTHAGNLVSAYDLKRTVCDCVRSRNKIETETFLVFYILNKLYLSLIHI